VQLEDEAGWEGSVEETGTGPVVSELHRGVDDGRVKELLRSSVSILFCFPTNRKKNLCFW
jgi:hypothetical protein